MGVDRRAVWWRWLAAPWAERGLAAALIAAAAAPVMLVGSADVWRAASQDDVAARAVADASLERNGVDVEVEAAFEPQTAGAADAEITAAVDAIGPLEMPSRTTYTLTGLVTIGPPPLRQVGPTARVFAADGALDAIEVVEQAANTNGGVWVTTWFGERHGLTLGDRLAFEAGAIVDEQWNDLVQGGGANSVFRIVGFYEPLWSADPDHVNDPFWSDVPPAIVPRFITAFNAPNFTLVLTDEMTLLDSSLTGVIRWQAPLSSIPDTFDGLGELAARLRRFETDLVGTGSLGAAMADVATSAGRRPILATQFFETEGEARRAARRLDSPLAAARGVGGIVGLAAAVAIGVFLVERRRTEFRLLASEGDGPVRMSTRVAAQLVAPFAVGGLIGVAGAVIGPWWFGPARGLEIDAIRWGPVLAVWAASIVLASVTAGVLGARALRPADPALRRTLRRFGLFLLAAMTVATWIQVGRTTTAGDDLDLVVVALPVMAILLAVWLMLIVVGWALGRTIRSVDRLPVEAFLAVRRLARGSTGVRLAAAALGLGIGLLVFAAALTATLDRTVDVKLATEVGGATAVALIDDLPVDFDPPAPTTVVRTFDSTLTPGRVPTRIIAVDIGTFSDAVTWSDEFGAELVSVLAEITAGGDSIPMVGVIGEPAPNAGAFGTTRAFQYRVTDRIAAFPGAGERKTSLLASAEAIDAFAARSNGYESPEDAAADGFPLPVDAFRRLLISQAGPDEIVTALDDAGVRYRSVVSQAERRREPAVVATRAAFRYLGVIGLVALVAAAVSLVLFLSARRRLRALTGVMTGSMGLSAGRGALVSALELAVMLVVAVGASFAVVPAVVRRLSGRFDPAPERPPDVPVHVSWLPLVGAAALGALLICAVVWLVERRAARRPAGEVLRDVG